MGREFAALIFAAAGCLAGMYMLLVSLAVLAP